MRSLRLVFFGCVCLTVCGKHTDAQQPTVLGRYYSESHPNSQFCLELKPGGVLVISGRGRDLLGTYELAGSEIILRTRGERPARFKVLGSTLVDPEGERWTKNEITSGDHSTDAGSTHSMPVPAWLLGGYYSASHPSPQYGLELKKGGVLVITGPGRQLIGTYESAGADIILRTPGERPARFKVNGNTLIDPEGGRWIRRETVVQGRSTDTGAGSTVPALNPNNRENTGTSPVAVTAASIRQIDFRNFRYPSNCSKDDAEYPEIISVSNGKWRRGREGGDGYKEYEIAATEYARLLGSSEEQAVIVASCFLGNWSETEVFIYALNNGKLLLIQRLTDSDWAPEGCWIETVKPDVKNNRLSVSFLSGGIHAQPDWSVTAIIIWNGSRFVREQAIKKPFKP